MFQGPFSRLNNLLNVEPSISNHLLCHLGSPVEEPCIDIKADLRRNVDLHNISKYPSSDGLDDFKSAAFSALASISGVEHFESISRDIDVIVTSGTREAIFNLVVHAKQANPEKRYAIVPSPCYPGYVGSCNLSGLEVYTIDLIEENGFVPDLGSVPESVLNDCAVMILTNPGNPFGFYINSEQQESILNVAQRYGIECIFDECFIELCISPTVKVSSAAKLMAQFSNLSIIHSLSKRSSVAGLRSGFICSNTEKIKGISGIRAFISPTVPNFIQLSSAFLWSDSSHVEAARSAISRKIQIASTMLPDDLVIYPEAGFFISIRTGDEVGLTRLLYRNGLKAMPLKFLCHKNGRSIDEELGLVRVGLVYEEEKVPEICQIIIKSFCSL